MWLVLQCQLQPIFFGRQSTGKSLACPHCNHADAKILSRHLSANEASKAVSVANVPPEIRDQLSTWMEQQPQLFDAGPEVPVDGVTILAEAEDESGLITPDSLQKHCFPLD